MLIIIIQLLARWDCKYKQIHTGHWLLHAFISQTNATTLFEQRLGASSSTGCCQHGLTPLGLSGTHTAYIKQYNNNAITTETSNIRPIAFPTNNSRQSRQQTTGSVCDSMSAGSACLGLYLPHTHAPMTYPDGMVGGATAVHTVSNQHVIHGTMTTRKYMTQTKQSSAGPSNAAQQLRQHNLTLIADSW